MTSGLLVGCLDTGEALSTEEQELGTTASSWETYSDQTKLLTPSAQFTFSSTSATPGVPIFNVNPSQTYQYIVGFGAGLPDSSAFLIQQKLSIASRNDLMSKLFGSTGIRVSMLRIPLGASDLVKGAHYSYDSTCCNLTDFSVSRDQDVLNTAFAAKQLNSSLVFMGSPWSPPAWMKSNNDLKGGYLNLAYYPMYADYLKKTVDAFASAGVPLSYLTVQNEPRSGNTTHPSAVWEWYDEVNFVRDHLGPKLQSTTAKIVSFDHNFCDSWYPDAVLSDTVTNSFGKRARDYIVGSAWHNYSCGAFTEMTVIRNNHPDKGIFFTEFAYYLGNSFGNHLTNMAANVFDAVNNWSRTAVFWPLALDNEDPGGGSGPHNGGCDACVGLADIEQDNGTFTLTGNYYGMGHFSKFVPPGSVRVAVNQNSGTYSAAFQTPSCEIVLVVLNLNTAYSFYVQWAGTRFLRSNLPANSVVTFKWSIPQCTLPPV